MSQRGGGGGEAGGIASLEAPISQQMESIYVLAKYSLH